MLYFQYVCPKITETRINARGQREAIEKGVQALAIDHGVCSPVQLWMMVQYPYPL